MERIDFPHLPPLTAAGVGRLLAERDDVFTKLGGHLPTAERIRLHDEWLYLTEQIVFCKMLQREGHAQ